MAKNIQIKENEISTGVALKVAQRKAQEIFEQVVLPQVEQEAQLSSEQKKISLSPKQKDFANCHSPY